MFIKLIFALRQWFSRIKGESVPQWAYGNVRRHFSLSQLGMGGGGGMARHLVVRQRSGMLLNLLSPHNKELSGPKMADVDKLCSEVKKQENVGKESVVDTSLWERGGVTFSTEAAG